MREVRKIIGGLGNLMFKQAFIYAQMRKELIPDLYVQGDSYWHEFRSEIKTMFGEGIGHTDKVALHIRRGDYVNNPFYIDLWQTDYYKKAIALFSPGTEFIVFCKDNQGWEQDKADRQWCRDNLAPILGDRFELPPKENTEIEDFNLMASCIGHIMANSSFSWWAAYLNPNQDKEIVCPKKWFTDGQERIELQESWIKI